MNGKKIRRQNNILQKCIKNSQLHPLRNNGHGSPIDQAID